VTGRSVLITGATRGIGRGLFDACSARGDIVFGTTRSADQGGPQWLRADMADAGSIAGLAAQITGPLDLLVCNAGVYLDKGQTLASGFAANLWTESFAVNVTGVFLTIQALLPNLSAAKGKIAILSSQMASSTRAPGGSYIYRASKAAVLNLGRNLATDLKPQGVAVGIYHPGWVQTDMGGTGADLGLAQSVAGLVARFDALSLATTGCFETWDGRAHPY
jgi:NAD(P)-dependent dehydrogenase (short-subunit alcohol dehydrogenase family)